MDRDDEGRRAIALQVNAWYLYDLKDDLGTIVGRVHRSEREAVPFMAPHVTSDTSQTIPICLC